MPTIEAEQVRNNSPNSKWFSEFREGFIATIKSHELMLETDIAPETLKRFYDALISNREIDSAVIAREHATMSLVRAVIFEYLNKIGKFINDAISVAVDFSLDGVFIWIVIPNDREDIENAFLIAEMEVNGKFAPTGISVESMIIEEWDAIPVPPHYQTIKEKTH